MNIFANSRNKFKHIFIALLLFAGSLLVYRQVFPNPRTWYDHYKYLSQSIMDGRVDVDSFPSYYQDAVKWNGHKYLPFGPAPSLIIIPFLLINSNTPQQTVSIIIGSLNVAALYLLLKRHSPRAAPIVSIFFAFGTVAFWSSIAGTSWYFAHNVAFLFLTLALLAHYSKKDFLSGLLLTVAILSRYPILLASVFFILQTYKDKKRLFFFLLGLAPLFPINFWYNFIRFGKFTEMGYLQLYEMYTKGNYGYSFIRIVAPKLPYLGYMDILNIPLHLITFLVLPPIVSENFIIKPSPYGTGILFVSPLLLLALWPKLKDTHQRNLFLGALAVALVEFLHYAQGWVQFGYRFAMDFLPFLLLILALRYKPSKLFFTLFIFSLAATLWGTLWAIKLGW